MYEFAMTIVCVMNGIVVSFVRALIGFVIAVFMFEVLNKTLIPRWIVGVVRCDVPWLCYVSEVYLYHMYCNPVVRGFAKLLMGERTAGLNASKRIWRMYAKLKCGY